MRYKKLPAGKGTAVIVIVVAGLLSGATGCGAHAASTASRTPATSATGPVINCNGIDCSLYLSRAGTQKFNADINDANGGIAGLVASCGLFVLISGPAGVIVAVACGASVAAYGGLLLNTVSRAASDNGCLRIQFRALKIHVPFTRITKLAPLSPGLAFNDDHSRYCH